MVVALEGVTPGESAAKRTNAGKSTAPVIPRAGGAFTSAGAQPQADIAAIDLSTGKKGTIKWKMDPGTDRAWAGDVACCGVNNRGVALWKDKIISIALDGRMFAIDKATGEVVWERKVADPALGETLTVAPLAPLWGWKDMPKRARAWAIAFGAYALLPYIPR